MQGLDLFFKRTASYEPSSLTSSSHEHSSSSETVTNNLDKLLSITEREVSVEIYWLLKVVEGHFSFRSCTDISSSFKVMCGGDNKIAQKIFCSRTKCSFMISCGFVPFLKETLI